jgi:heterodisulfide reductase subunit A-like polyferredoxin
MIECDDNGLNEAEMFTRREVECIVRDIAEFAHDAVICQPDLSEMLFRQILKRYGLLP